MKPLAAKQILELQQLRLERKRLIAQKNWQGALAIIDQMLAIEPTLERWNNRGVMLKKLNLLPQAIESFEQALQLDPECKELQHKIAKIKKTLAHQTKESPIIATPHSPPPIDRDTANKAAMADLKGKTSTSNQSPTISSNQFMKSGSRLKDISRYRIIKVLGHGAMGIVYLAKDPQLKREIALKTVLLADDVKIVKRFIQEAETMAQLQHPNIVKVYDVGKEQGMHYFTMEYIQGVTLAQKIEEQGFSLHQRLKCLYEIALAVDYAHTKGIFHRDIKPGNIMVNDKNRSLIMDFGIALVQENDTKLSKSGDIVGTPAYMSPEQAQGKREEIDERSDVYALGTVLYQLLTGQQPFVGPSHTVIYEIIEKEPIKPRHLVKNLAIDIENVCLKAMAKDKTHRYQSARELAADIRRFLHGEPVLAMPSSQFYRIKKWIARNRLVASIIVFFVLTIFSLGFNSQWQVLQQAKKARQALVVAQAQKNRAVTAKKEVDKTLTKVQKDQQQIRALLQEAQKARNIAKKAKQKAQQALVKAQEEQQKAQTQRQKIKAVQRKIIDSTLIALNNKNVHIKINAMRTIQAFGKRATKTVPAVLKELKHKKSSVRIEAAVTLGVIGSQAHQAIPGLIQALSSWGSSTKKYAAAALVKIGAKAIAALEKLKRRCDNKTKIQVIAALNELKLQK